MLAKGVVVVPSATRWTGPWLGATRATSLQRVANRPIVCHVLDALQQAGVIEVAVIAPYDVSEEIAGCIECERPPGVEIRYLTHEPGRDEDALLTAAEFVGDAPCILHRADGLLGQPLGLFLETLREESSDALLLLGGEGREVKRLRLVPRPLLTATEEVLASAPESVAGVCLLGPSALQRLASPERAAQTLDFTALTERLTRGGGRVQMRAVQKWRHFTGDALDLLDMNRMMLDAMDPDSTAAATDDNRFEGPVSIHPTASCELEHHRRTGDHRRRRLDRRLLHRVAHLDRRACSYRRRRAGALDCARRRERAPRGWAPRRQHRRPGGTHFP